MRSRYKTNQSVDQLIIFTLSTSSKDSTIGLLYPLSVLTTGSQLKVSLNITNFLSFFSVFFFLHLMNFFKLASFLTSRGDCHRVDVTSKRMLGSLTWRHTDISEDVGYWWVERVLGEPGCDWVVERMLTACVQLGIFFPSSSSSSFALYRSANVSFTNEI